MGTNMNDIHHLLLEWADEQDSGALWYPSESVEGRIVRNGGILPSNPPRSIVPFVSFRLSAVRREVDRLPKKHRYAIYVYYKADGTKKDRQDRWMKHTGKSRASYYRHLKEARQLLASKIGDTGYAKT
jgi:hypothetical protein